MPKPIEGHMINGKFMDRGGRVYDIIPAEAVILGDITGNTGDPNNGNGTKDKSVPQSPQPQAGQPPYTPPQKGTPQPKPKPKTEEKTPLSPPVSTETPQPTPPSSALIDHPGCISFEILKAVQTSSFAQVSVRAHCKELFADSVVHYDFETIKQICDSDIWVSQPGDFLKFKQTALKTAHAEAVKTAREILCEQFNQKEN